MFTRCTECRTLQTVTTEQLRTSLGLIRCEKCSGLFNALKFISDFEDQETPAEKPWLSPPNSPTKTTYWYVGSTLGVAVLLAQLLYFEAPALPQNSSFRPWLEKLCSAFGCQLPAYQDTKELTVLQGALTTQADNSIVFNAVITNQAAFAQAYPKLKLTLMDYAGMPFSQRIFQPNDYLSTASAAPRLIMPDANHEISLSLAVPQTQIGGYTFELN